MEQVTMNDMQERLKQMDEILEQQRQNLENFERLIGLAELALTTRPDQKDFIVLQKRELSDKRNRYNANQEMRGLCARIANTLSEKMETPKTPTGGVDVKDTRIN